MKRIILPLSLALSLSCGAAFAQQTQDQTPQQAPATEGHPHHRHAPDPQRQAEFLTKKLNLTTDQTAKIEPILADRDQKMQALWQNQQLTPQDRHQQMRSINQSTEQQMAGVLSPDQMTQLKAMRREHRGHHGQREGENGNQGQSPS